MACGTCSRTVSGRTRTAALPGHGRLSARQWTYARPTPIRRRRGALHLADRESVEPRLAIYAENHSEGASPTWPASSTTSSYADQPAFNLDNIVAIFDALASHGPGNDRERIVLLKEARRRTARPSHPRHRSALAAATTAASSSFPSSASSSAPGHRGPLERRRRFRRTKCHVMYTSGSTDVPRASPSRSTISSPSGSPGPPRFRRGPGELFLSFLPSTHLRPLPRNAGHHLLARHVPLRREPLAETLFGLLPKTARQASSAFPSAGPAP